MNRVATRYPLPVRLGAVLVCTIFAASIAKDPVSNGTIIVAVGAACLSVAILAYRAEIDEAEVRVRYVPFLTKRTQIRDVTHVVEERTLVLVTPTSKIPLWGLSDLAREVLFRILPARLMVAPLQPGRPGVAVVRVRRHVRVTILAAVVFVTSTAFSIPFLRGNPWNAYVDTIGKYVLFICLCAFLFLLFEAGFTWVLWSTKRDIDKIDNGHLSPRAGGRGGGPSG